MSLMNHLLEDNKKNQCIIKAEYEVGHWELHSNSNSHNVENVRAQIIHNNVICATQLFVVSVFRRFPSSDEWPVHQRSCRGPVCRLLRSSSRARSPKVRILSLFCPVRPLGKVSRI